MPPASRRHGPSSIACPASSSDGCPSTSRSASSSPAIATAARRRTRSPRTSTATASSISPWSRPGSTRRSPTRPRRSVRGSPRPSTTSAFWPSSCSCPAASCSSTSWPRAPTTAGTGRSMPRRRASSPSRSAPSPGAALGATTMTSPAVAMVNLLGDLWFPDGAGEAVEPAWATVLADPTQPTAPVRQGGTATGSQDGSSHGARRPSPTRSPSER